MKQIKEELDLTVIVHTGIINQAVAKGLADTGIDAALIDIIGAQETIEDIYNLNIQVIDYQRSLQALSEAGIPFIPHVIVGLHHGKLLGEVHALEMIAKYTPNGLVIIALIPLPGTPMQQVSPPRVEDIVQVIARARVMMPSIPIALGCMRPKGRHRKRTDVLAVKAGVSAIAYPVEEAVDLAKLYGLQIHFSPLCCSQMYDYFRRIS
jgi:uncharacterized radical SAM superfamily protein